MNLKRFQAAHAGAIATLFCVSLTQTALAAPPSPTRSKAVVAEFQRTHPCPSTGASRGKCPGYEADHVQPLCAGGLDTPDNLQWLTRPAHADKTQRDLAGCAGRAYRPGKAALGL